MLKGEGSGSSGVTDPGPEGSLVFGPLQFEGGLDNLLSELLRLVRAEVSVEVLRKPSHTGT